MYELQLFKYKKRASLEKKLKRRNRYNLQINKKKPLFVL